MYIELVSELKNISDDITQEQKINMRASQMDARIVDVVRYMKRMLLVVKNEGGLKLKENVKNNRDLFEYHDFFEKLVVLFADGADSDLIKEYAISRYFSANEDGYAALIMLLYIECVYGLLKGYSPLTVEMLMVALLPLSIVDKYEKYKDI